MKRRTFLGHAGTLAAMPVVLPYLSGPFTATAAPLRVNGPRLNEWLTSFDRIGRTPTGINRVAYSEADLAGRAFTLQLLRDAGLTPRIDTAGNIYARLDGTDRTLAPILIGSHIDSVTDGGNFDGPVGSFGAIEVARTLREKGTRLRHPLDVVIWQNEEGGTTGSKTAIGEMNDVELAKVARSGKTIRDGIGIIGGDVSRLSESVKKKGD
ncbi:M20/M25/M40 family metallo-hydrolase, partial [Gemmatimonas sp.]|uniref:M20/M25/M40 family metallo-hydrolase n=1 Tax=Gemmatimonas sp. TaxID=1962908 RepID=UPI0037C0A782